MTALECLALKYNTDKHSHGYCPHYERFIGDMRLLPLTMIEIGIGNGESLSMWREWMPNAKINGFDQKEFTHPDSSIKSFIGLQENVEDLEAMTQETGYFHFVVDDASHQPKNYAASFHYLWGKLANHGWYVIEDLDSTWSCIDMDVINNDRIRDITRGVGSIEEFHLIGKNNDSGSGILFLKKR